ncbi:TIGR00730 family Rossman fold protein [Benzoatithermus flavus]|uniref:AMP nucleosidase n=1 Tax=Benzoatithermus flavus TaxID=3108223 RepID=A0ABU8XYV6_9PROT
MADANPKHLILPSAREDAARVREVPATPQTLSPSYRLAFTDTEFLLREELRPVRLQLELLKPELELLARRIDSTIVIFGSARIAEPEKARARREAAEAAAAAAPDDPKLAWAAELARRLEKRSRSYEEARRFAQLVSTARRPDGKQRYVIVTGGGPGIMEAANRGAHDVGAISIGHNIVLPHEQAPNPYITPELCFQFHYFALRKMHLTTRARALVVFPGGFGTLDELFEILCLIQTGKSRPMPVLLFDEAYWRRVIDFEFLAEEGMIDPHDLNIFRFVETAEQAWEVIRRHYGDIEPEAAPVG